MEFLVILTAWLLLQWLGPGFMHPHDRWLIAWHLHAGRALSLLPRALRLALIVILPGALVALLAWLAGHWLAGALLFPLYLVVLAYSLGRGDYRTELDNYLERWQRGDLEAAYQVAMQSGFHIDPAADARDLHLQLRRVALYTGFQRWFAVVFWFALLGPAPALCYRLLHLLYAAPGTDIEERPLLARWLYWLDWIPARLLGLAFAVTGNFVECFRVWREHVFVDDDTGELLVSFAAQAVPGAAAGSDELGGEHFIELAANEIRELRDLMRRSAIFWLVVLALLQLW